MENIPTSYFKANLIKDGKPINNQYEFYCVYCKEIMKKHDTWDNDDWKNHSHFYCDCQKSLEEKQYKKELSIIQTKYYNDINALKRQASLCGIQLKGD